jgi:hypothetical protein
MLEQKKVEGIMGKFQIGNNLEVAIDNSGEKKRYFYEKHFHICLFLLLDKVLDKNSPLECEKACTRLHTLINNVNQTSTGYIDIYFKDGEEENIVEVKNIDLEIEKD